MSEKTEKGAWNWVIETAEGVTVWSKDCPDVNAPNRTAAAKQLKRRYKGKIFIKQLFQREADNMATKLPITPVDNGIRPKRGVDKDEKENPAAVTPLIEPKMAAKPVKETAAKIAKKLGNTVKAAVRRDKIKTPSVGKSSLRMYIINALLSRQFTDEEILANVHDQYGDIGYTTKLAYVQLTRADMNAGHIKSVIVDGRMSGYIGKLIRDDQGKLVELPYKPSHLRKTVLQFGAPTA